MAIGQTLSNELRIAIKQGDTERLLALLGNDKRLLEMSTPFGTWLHVAAAHDRLEIVKKLVSLGMAINRNGGILGGTALNEAASEGHVEVVRYLLSQGAQMDVRDPRHNP